jgi:hypothetical protein
MKKLRLDVDALVVETFDTAHRAARGGTVRANEQVACPQCCCCPCCCTCDATCANTCDDATCLSCEYTCQNEYTCAYYSCYTCDPCVTGDPFTCPPYCDM